MENVSTHLVVAGLSNVLISKMEQITIYAKVTIVLVSQMEQSVFHKLNANTIQISMLAHTLESMANVLGMVRSVD